MTDTSRSPHKGFYQGTLLLLQGSRIPSIYRQASVCSLPELHWMRGSRPSLCCCLLSGIAPSLGLSGLSTVILSTEPLALFPGQGVRDACAFRELGIQGLLFSCVCKFCTASHERERDGVLAVSPSLLPLKELSSPARNPQAVD